MEDGREKGQKRHVAVGSVASTAEDNLIGSVLWRVMKSSEQKQRQELRETIFVGAILGGAPVPKLRLQTSLVITRRRRGASRESFRLAPVLFPAGQGDILPAASLQLLGNLLEKVVSPPADRMMSTPRNVIVNGPVSWGYAILVPSKMRPDTTSHSRCLKDPVRSRATVAVTHCLKVWVTIRLNSKTCPLNTASRREKTLHRL